MGIGYIIGAKSSVDIQERVQGGGIVMKIYGGVIQKKSQIKNFQRRY